MIGSYNWGLIRYIDRVQKVVHDLSGEDEKVWPLPITLGVDGGTVQQLSPDELLGLQSSGNDLIVANEIEGNYIDLMDSRAV